ncbi:hypothetical protein ACWEOE_06750 [Amycolatopsis sp. NPDC004368]
MSPQWTKADRHRLDADRVRAWTLVRAVQNRLWFESDLREFADLGDEQPSWAALPVLTSWALKSLAESTLARHGSATRAREPANR